MAQRPITSFFSQAKPKPAADSVTSNKTAASENTRDSSAGSDSVDSDEMLFVPETNTAPPKPVTQSRKPTKSNSKNSAAPPSKKQRVNKSRISDYKQGALADPQFYSDPAKSARHAKFVHELTSKRARTNTDGRTGRRDMKPYDLQFLDLKKECKDSILCVQNGYKYQILAEDAYKAARVLGRSPVAGWRELHGTDSAEDTLYDRFASLTFPIERLPFYIEKLVRQGLKVSVAKQIETSALKAQSGNKRGPFVRKVTNVYTRGTMVEELTSTSVVNGPITAIASTSVKPLKTAVFSVLPATGSAYTDYFDDTELATELETRLLHLQPSEILVLGELHGVALNLVNSTGATIITKEWKDGTSPEDACQHAMHEYLHEFGLDKALDLEVNAFCQSKKLNLNGDTLRSLDIFSAAPRTDTFGSLFWALDATKSTFGKRLLRSWVGAPLVDREMLAERVEAVEEIMQKSSSTAISNVVQALGKAPDLERALLQSYHARIQPRQMYWFLYYFDQLASSITETVLAAANIVSPMLLDLLNSLIPVKPIIRNLLASINAQVARNFKPANLPTYFVPYDDDEEEDPDSNGESADVFKTHLSNVAQLELEIANCRAEFDAFIRSETEKLGIPLRLARAQGEEDTFVIGVPKKFVSKVPEDWRRQGAVTTEVRFWAPFSIEQTKILKPLLEHLELAAQAAYDGFVGKVSSYFIPLRKTITSMASFDCLHSLAVVSTRENYVKPEIVDGRCLEISDGRHPMLELVAEQSDTLNVHALQYIPNSVSMYENNNRAMIITGANMGGKSSFVRQVALIVIMAQLGAYVPATKVRMSLVDAVYTRMGAFDNVLRGESTFMVELKECANIMEKATPRSLVLLDEIGRGTSTMDGVAIAEAVLRYMVENVQSFTLFITHYPSLCDLDKLYPNVLQNWSMDCAETDDEVTFLYKIVPKRASKSYGINVARLAELPQSIIAAAEQKATEMEANVLHRRNAAVLMRNVQEVLAGDLDPSVLIPEEEDESIAETQV